MVEVTLNPERPSESIIRAANTTATVTDAQGRQITLKKLNALDRMRLFEVVGSDNISNEAYFGYASLAYHVTAIDGDPVAQPRSKAQLEALVQRLDDDGMNAIAAGVAEHFFPKNEDAKETAKKG